jgi:DNA (cytosine-5)-methyltransferase 1
MNKHRFNYKWNLADGYPKSNGLKVFGTFICGGGSTMGYKLAGFEHLGGVEIDPPIADVYKTNHNPKYLYVEDIRDFADRTEFPEDLYDLDILDGSPPCSSFSMAGNREKDWGKEKKFREGQTVQTLDDLFFDYIKLAKKLQPKVIIAENVKGLIQGNAKVYVHKIKAALEDAGYKVQLFLLNAASMGVPQKRERVFFICQRNDLKFKDLKLSFNEDAINFSQVT